MWLVLARRHFGNRRGGEPGNEVRWLNLPSCTNHDVASSSLFVLQSPNNLLKPRFLSISFTACLTSLIFQQYSKEFREEFK